MSNDPPARRLTRACTGSVGQNLNQEPAGRHRLFHVLRRLFSTEGKGRAAKGATATAPPLAIAAAGFYLALWQPGYY